MDFNKSKASESFARLGGGRNTTIVGDINFVAPDGIRQDMYVTVYTHTNLQVRDLTKPLTVNKTSVGLSDGAILAVGDQESLNLLNLKTTYSTRKHNQTAVEQVSIVQSETDESTYNVVLTINYFAIRVNNYGHGGITDNFVKKGNTLLQDLDGIVNKQVEDYYIYKNEYYVDYANVYTENIDVATFVPTLQGSTLIVNYWATEYEIKYENLKGAYIDPNYIDNFDSTNVMEVGELQPIPTKYALMNLPSENEFIFDGWSFTLGGAKIGGNNNRITITDELCRGFTLYARWINVYTVTIDSLNGDTPTVQYVKEGEKATAPTTTPTLSKHEFLNWYDSADANKKAFNFNKGITSNVTINANWLRIWEVTFDASDADEVGLGFDKDTKLMTVLVRDGESYTQ
jgi:hypothetical protein